jgi:NADPH-dependent curcumin reductase CurA
MKGQDVTAMKMNREVRLARKPGEQPVLDDFEVVRVAMPELVDGEVLIENLLMSIDPYMLSRLQGTTPGLKPYVVGEVLNGRALGKIVRSRHDQWPVGTLAMSFLGWREYATSTVNELIRIDAAATPLTTNFHVLGTPGRCAYVSLLELCEAKAGETVYVSNGASAIGSVAVQIAKLIGCRVVASVGSDEKRAWLEKELGVDRVINYKATPDLETALSEACPKGLDVFIDLVGSPFLQAALTAMNKFGRAAIVGALPPIQPGPNNIGLLAIKNIRLLGFNNANYTDRHAAFASQMGNWIAEGKIKWRESISEGLESAPGALLAIRSGAHIGKPLVRLSSTSAQDLAT